MPDTQLLEHALRYASLSWYIFPLHQIIRSSDGSARCGCGNAKCGSPGKHPRIKWKAGAACDPDVARAWWSRWPSAGIGCATGPSGLVVFDLDGPKGAETFRNLIAGAGPAMTAIAKTARGAHVFFRGEAPTSSDPATKLDVRSTGGYVVLAPSPHASGHTYSWEVAPWNVAIPECPPVFLEYARTKKRRPAGMRSGRQGDEVVNKGEPLGKVSSGGITLPDYLTLASEDFGDRLGAILQAVDWAEVERALARIPANCSMDEWVRVGMALHQASNGSPQGLDIWDKWSRTSKGVGPGNGEYAGRDKLEYSWSNWKPDGGVTLGTLFDLALRHGYKRGMDTVIAPISEEKEEDSSPQAAEESGHCKGMNGHTIDPATSDFFANLNSESDNPLIRLNKEFAVIGNVGGKCLVLSWENSPIDEEVKVPAFQSFKSFSERFANQYVMVTKTKHLKDGDQQYEEPAQLGSQWLKWPQRRTYQALELRPNAPEVLPNGNYNLWQGWGVTPTPGCWARMRDHIGLVLADGSSEAADYILKWSAWTVQNPGLPAGVACVTRGGQGAGKGVFGRSLCRIFGAHALQIFHAKHLVGSFNEHMRSCLFLFADEAHWAGDKQGAATLKGLITEPTRMLEGKGVNAVMWPNQVTLFMGANADWVVPAAHDERRYAVFNVSNSRAQNLAYFAPLYEELKNGGLGAMLFDLLNMDIGAWTPMPAIQTKALQHQKDLSMDPLMEWWYGMLTGDGELRFAADRETEWSGLALNESIRQEIPKHSFSGQRVAEFLRKMGATDRHSMTGSKWRFPSIADARTRFEEIFGTREWRVTVDQWAKEEESKK